MREFDLQSRIVPATNRLVPRYAGPPEPSDSPLPEYLSMLGTFVYSSFQFLRTSGTSFDNSLNVGEVKKDSGVFLTIDTVLISVSQSKNIAKTPILGRNGTIKEYISEGDYYIDIRGMIVTEHPLQYPREQVSLLNELLSLPKAIPVASDFLNIFGIDTIAVEYFMISEKLGSRNEVPFEIQAVSDYAEEITLNPNDQVNR